MNSFHINRFMAGAFVLGFCVYIITDAQDTREDEQMTGREQRLSEQDIRQSGRKKTKKSKKNKHIDIKPESEKLEKSIDEQALDEIVIDQGQKVFSQAFDQEAKKQAVMALVDKATAFLQKNSLAVACNAFTHSNDFISGEVYVFVLDTKGVFIAHGQQREMLWKNSYDLKDSFDRPFVQLMIKKAKEGGGWTTYEWRDTNKNSYVKLVKKDGTDYVVGAGYYPHSKIDVAVNLVKGAVNLFEQSTREGRPAEEVFGAIGYPLSERFVRGDLYLYALDFQGNIIAQGNRPGLVGTNAWDYKDSMGKLVNQEIIKKLDSGAEGVWIDYMSKNAQKKAYAEKVQDAQGKKYFIACGYYPEADRDRAVDLVRRGYQYMKANGKSQAAHIFTDKRDDTYRYGDLWIEVYDMKGLCVAHGGNEELVGRNLWDVQDEDKSYYVREFIQKAKDGGGWVDSKINNSFQSTYIEKVDLGIEEFVIVSGLYALGKRETMLLLVKSGVGYLRIHNLEEAFEKFTNPNDKFIRGDLFLFVFDSTGICYVWGDVYSYVWKNLLDWKDDDGRPFIRLFINSAKQGSSQISFRLNSRQGVAQVEQVEKDGKTFVIGSSYYL